MGRPTNIQRIEKALDYLENGQGIFLNSDTFLVGDLLDGSDKCYGFGKVNKRIQAVTRENTDGVPLTDLTKGDIDYIINASVVRIHKGKKYTLGNIYEKILAKKYPTIKYEDI